MGQDSWEMSGMELLVEGIREQDHCDVERQDVPVKTFKDMFRSYNGLIHVEPSTASPIPEDRQYLTRFAKGPNGEWVDVVKAGRSMTQQRAYDGILPAPRAGKQFHACSSFKQSFVESWQALISLMNMKLHPRLNSQARQLLDAMDAAQQRQFLGRT